MVERWNGMVEWWNGGMCANDPVPHLAHTTVHYCACALFTEAVLGEILVHNKEPYSMSVSSPITVTAVDSPKLIGQGTASNPIVLGDSLTPVRSPVKVIPGEKYRFVLNLLSLGMLTVDSTILFLYLSPGISSKFLANYRTAIQVIPSQQTVACWTHMKICYQTIATWMNPTMKILVR